MATVVSVNISEKKGTKKIAVNEIELISDYGIKGDAHAGKWHRQVSLLPMESIDEMINLGYELKPGDFAENITTKGIELKNLPIGTIIMIGNVKLEVTQIGKKCHNDCEIKKMSGKCVMPTEGIFARVLNDGFIKIGEKIEINRD